MWGSLCLHVWSRGGSLCRRCKNEPCLYTESFPSASMLPRFKIKFWHRFRFSTRCSQAPCRFTRKSPVDEAFAVVNLSSLCTLADVGKVWAGRPLC